MVPLWDLVHDRWEKGKHPEMKVLSWDRQRKAQRPEMPTEAGSRLEFAKALADDYVVRSKEKVTWASYRGWWMVFMEFMRFVGVDQCGGAEDWRVSVEVLQVCLRYDGQGVRAGDDQDFHLGGEFLFQNEGVAGALHKREVPDDDAGHREGHRGQEDQEATSGGEACGRADGHG